MKIKNKKERSYNPSLCVLSIYLTWISGYFIHETSFIYCDVYVFSLILKFQKQKINDAVDDVNFIALMNSDDKL
jgi:hypothetical protein